MNTAPSQKPPLGAKLNYGHPLARGLVGSWLFNETSGNIVHDYSGNDRHATITGVAAQSAVSGWGPENLALDGTNDYLQIRGPSPVATYTSDFSAGVDSFATTTGTVAGDIDDIPDAGGYDDVLRMTCNNAASTHTFYRGSTFVSGKRYRISFNYYIPSTNSNVDGIKLGSAYHIPLPVTVATLDSWTAAVWEGIVNTATLNFYITDGDDILFTDAGGDDVVYIKNVTVTELPTSPLFFPDTKPWSFAVRLLATSFPAEQPIFAGSSYTGYGPYFEFTATSTTFREYYLPGTTRVWAYTFVANTYYTIIYTMKADETITAYVNGKSLGSLTATWSTMVMEKLGGALIEGGTSYFLPGNFDFAHVYNRALSHGEVERLTASPYCMFGSR